MKDEELLMGIYDAISVYLFYKVDRTTEKINWTTGISPKFGSRAWDIQVSKSGCKESRKKYLNLKF